MTSYILGFIVTFGLLIGVETIENNNKTPSFKDQIQIIILCIVWPVVLGLVLAELLCDQKGE